MANQWPLILEREGNSFALQTGSGNSEQLDCVECHENRKLQ